MKTLFVTIAVDVSSMTGEELSEAGYYEYVEEDDVPPTVSDYTAEDVAACVLDAVNNPDARSEMFAGSDIFLSMSDAKVVGSAWHQE